MIRTDYALADEAVDAINAVSGAHPGARAAHAKGTLCTGTFTATPAAAALTTAPHMQGEPVPATIRLSNGGGNPGMPDYAREGRGLAVKFELPDGSRTDIVALNLPAFFVRTPEDFVEFTLGRVPDPETGQPDMERLGAFMAAHPESHLALGAALGAQPPASYACVAFNSIHAFRWTAPDGTARYVRYRFEPDAGEQIISPEEARAGGPDYLQEDLRTRLETGTIGFSMWVVIAADDDPVDDATVPWPEERERVEVGRLEVTGLEHTREKEGDILVFDPTRVCEGIECSDDPILHFRRRAYSVSVERRTGHPRL